jgi:hypothetical protein
LPLVSSQQTKKIDSVTTKLDSVLDSLQHTKKLECVLNNRHRHDPLDDRHRHDRPWPVRG